MAVNSRLSIVIDMESYRTVDGVSLTSSYQNLGSALAHPAVSVFAKNTTNTTVIITTNNGRTDGLRLPPSSADTVSMPAHCFPKGSQFRVKHNGTAATGGEVILQVTFEASK